MITINMLEGACADQKKTWQEEWPEGMTVTVENLQRAQALRLRIDWFVNNKFSTEQRAEYNRLRAAACYRYDTICNLAWAKYVPKNAWVEYGEACAPAVIEFRQATVAAFIAAWRKK